MDDNEDEDNYSDDGFDALPDNALLELEQNAVQATQQPNAGPGNTQTWDRQYPAPTKAPFNEVRPGYSYQQNATAQGERTYLLPQSHSRHPQFDGEEIEAAAVADENVATPVDEREEYVAQRHPDEVTQRELWRQARFGQPHVPQPPPRPYRQQDQQRNPATFLNPLQDDSGYYEQSRDLDLEDAMMLDEQDLNPVQDKTSDEASVLRAQIADLLREKDALAKELDTTKSAVITQRGEIAIIRANQGKESKVLDRQLAVLKQTIQEETARHKADIDAVNAESKKIETENQFLLQDLAEEAEKVKGLQRTLREKPRAERADGPVTTPKKSKELPFRDGFDDDEIMAISPIKSGRKSKGGTPTVGTKRKRKVNNSSPIAPLVLNQSHSDPLQQPDPAPEIEKPQPIVRRDPTVDKSLRFMQKILNHQSPKSSERLIETFTTIAFPSDPRRLLSSIVLEACARFSRETLPSDFLKLIIDLWSRALAEKYYKPIACLADTVHFVIALDSSVINPDIIIKLLPVLQSSGEVNGVARFKHSPVAHQNFGQFRQTPLSELTLEVNGTYCLEILYSVACICLENEDDIRLFWSSMSSDFVLMMLNSSQPISDLTLTLNLLSTSILPNTFGNVCGTEADQAKIEKYILERVTYLLWETPRVDEGQRVYSKAEIAELRIEAMALLSALALPPFHPHDDNNHHGSMLFASHPSAIGRLVRCIYDEVDALYVHGPGHELHATLVNEATRLVYRLLQLHGKSIDMQQKLLTINGGVQKHRVVLTRLAFSEGLYLEAGITDETVMMAHDMLEDAVTPEEAELLLEVFPAHKARRDDSTQS